MKPISKTFSFGNHQVTLETGEIARQAHGAVICRMDDTVVLAAVTAASTTVSSIVTRTAPCAWRAISPVSRVTWWAPYEKVFLVGFTGVLESKKRSSSDERAA